jgi:aspartate kinase
MADSLDLSDLLEDLTGYARADNILSNLQSRGIRVSETQLAEFLDSRKLQAHIALRQKLLELSIKVKAQNEALSAADTLQQIACTPRIDKNAIAKRLAAHELLALAGLTPKKDPTEVLHSHSRTTGRFLPEHTTPPPSPLPPSPPIASVGPNSPHIDCIGRAQLELSAPSHNPFRVSRFGFRVSLNSFLLLAILLLQLLSFRHSSFEFRHSPAAASFTPIFPLNSRPANDEENRDMGIVVQKFGGTSVATAERIHKAAEKVVAAKKAGNQVVVVVSAMGHTTDELIELAKKVWGDNPGQPPKREMDQLLATGEQVTIALIALALHAQGHEAISFTGGQIGMITDENFSKARVKELDKKRMMEELQKGKIVIVAGFQGITAAGDVTTLGRGGSNATLVAIGAVLQADVCENYTDVDGIFTADPRIVKDAKLIKEISYDEMMELSSVGASVLQTRAVEFAKKYNVPIHVRNSQTDRPGTMIVAETVAMEHIVVSGCALKKDLTRVSLKQVPDRPGVVAHLFSAVGAANIVVDDIIQNALEDGTANISFTVEHADVADLKHVVDKEVKELGGGVATLDTQLVKVSVVGVGMKQSTGVAAKMFGALAKEKINIQNISTSEIRISCLVAKEDGEKALRAVHAAFELGKTG